MQQVAARSTDVGTQVVREQVWAAYLLALVAAFTDAIGYLTLQQLGASFMSGNSMTTGIALGRAEWMSALNHGLPILSFLIGLLLGVLVLLQLRHWGSRYGFAAVFGLESLCLLAFLLIGSGARETGVIASSQAGIFYLCVVLLTVAMGLQTATLRKIGSQSVRTTFFTGVLSDLTDAFVHYFSWLHGQITQRRFRQALSESMQQPAFRNILLLGGIWGCYLGGAVCGSTLERRLSLGALVFPLCILLLLIVVDIVRPFDQ